MEYLFIYEDGSLIRSSKISEDDYADYVDGIINTIIDISSMTTYKNGKWINIDESI